MSAELSKLYKLMVLYMLRNVNFPLSNTQISEFFLNYEYTTYFVIQQVLAELLEAQFIEVEQHHNVSIYRLRSEGERTLEILEKDISKNISNDINQYLKENKIKMINEVSILSDYSEDIDKDQFNISLELLELDRRLIHIHLTAPDEKSSQYICNNWSVKSHDIYQYIIKKLLE